MLTGANPRTFKRGRDPWLTVLQTALVAIQQRCTDIPDALAEVIDRALADQLDLHFQHARDLHAALVSVAL